MKTAFMLFAVVSVGTARRVAGSRISMNALQSAMTSTEPQLEAEGRQLCTAKVPLSEERSGLHWSAKCKCTDDAAVLSAGCGTQAGERKFDVTKIQEEFKKNSDLANELPDDSCICEVPPRKEPVDQAMGKDLATVCKNTVAFAKPRESWHTDGRMCKCDVDWYLSNECGKQLAGKRKFDHRTPGVMNRGCRCQPEGETVAENPETFGGLVLAEKPRGERVAPTNTAFESARGQFRLECAAEFEGAAAGFAPGDMVKISKTKEPVTFMERYWWGGEQVPARVYQVVCPGATPATEGRICLRQGDSGPGSAGCWLPENLEKLYSLTATDLEAFMTDLKLQKRKTPEREPVVDAVADGAAKEVAEADACDDGSSLIDSDYQWLNSVEQRDDTLFAIFGRVMAEQGDHQFMVFRAWEGGSGTYLVKGDKGGKKTKFGLDYWFAKGSTCAEPTKSGCVSEFESGKTGGNLPSSIGASLVMPFSFKSTDEYTASTIGLTFTLRVVDGKPKAEIKGFGTPSNPCYLTRVHVCDSNKKAGSNFKPKKWYLRGRDKNGEPCGEDKSFMTM